ncbi:Wadjet anti-phage system protein JetD domain-containing protein [Psychrobacter lutiphocae]|uniref:Wadjet anti-phage system protein JetD domain-containing protein n=1 Tax=Psychrobacter lutiphocae TaxID=540500 RepID=UPI000373BA2C|nr:DUF3322 and DUF2220 domain-containing protein [Psychrobacter lutiphocae]
MTKKSKPTTSTTPNWGILPNQAIAQLKKREWDNTTRLRARLKNERPFPIILPLKPPKTGNDLLNHPNHFQDFVQAWREFEALHVDYSDIVQWQQNGFRHFAEQTIPTKIIIPNIEALVKILGTSAQNQLKRWQHKLGFIHSHLYKVMPTVFDTSTLSDDWQTTLFNALIDRLQTVDNMNDSELELLIKVIPQLQPNMGTGLYLRALPIHYVDTKFIETYDTLITTILEAFYPNQVKPIGLSRWLGCLDKPNGWLLVRPLCKQTQAKLGGLPILRLPTDTLYNHPLPANHILVVENEQSCLALPYGIEATKDTIAIAGGGKNVNWMNADWLQQRTVGYWGDIDSEGLAILSQARAYCPHLTALMMNKQTVLKFDVRMVNEPESKHLAPSHLTEEEAILFTELRQGNYENKRLEQERLPSDYINKALSHWKDLP